MAEPSVEIWETWLEKSVANDVYLMHLERHVWQEMHAVVGDNERLKNTSSYFWEWLFDIYAKTQAGAVRRQADERKDVASLGRLLVEIKNSPELLTRDWFLGHWGDPDTYDEDDQRYWKGVGEKEWADRWGGGDHIDSTAVAVDLTELRHGSKKVKIYVNKHVAHFDAGKIAPGKKEIELPTLNEVHDAIDLVGRLFRKYHALFTAADVIELTPVLQHDWKAVFRMQWVPELQLPKELRDYQEQREREKAEGKD